MRGGGQDVITSTSISRWTVDAAAISNRRRAKTLNEGDDVHPNNRSPWRTASTTPSVFNRDASSQYRSNQQHSVAVGLECSVRLRSSKRVVSIGSPYSRTYTHHGAVEGYHHCRRSCESPHKWVERRVMTLRITHLSHHTGRIERTTATTVMELHKDLSEAACHLQQYHHRAPVLRYPYPCLSVGQSHQTSH